MNDNHILALIVTYYLSKFDKDAYAALGHNTHKETHNDISAKLQVNFNSVKNMRDEFDAIHENPRVGWYQRELRPSRKRVVEAFQHLDEFGLREIVLSILQKQTDDNTVAIQQIVQSIQASEQDS